MDAGTYSNVYLNALKTLAVKLVKDTFTDESVSMFYREALYLKAGYGPKYYGLIVDTEQRFLGYCMEAYETSLSKLTFENCHEYLFINITKQLAKMHAEKIVHADIKPGNILLRLKESKIESSLTDFGISCYASDGGPSPSRFNDELYTPSFRPPELLFGSKNLSTAADIWALGMTMYYCAFCSDSKSLHNTKSTDILGFLELHVTADTEKRLGTFKALNTSLNKNYSTVFIEAMSACLAWLPEHRPTAKELYELLKVLPKEKVNLHFKTKDLSDTPKSGLVLYSPRIDYIDIAAQTEKTMKNLCVIGGLECNETLLKISQRNYSKICHVKASANQLVLVACLYALYEVRDSRNFKYQWSSKLVSMSQYALEKLMAQCFVELASIS